MTSTDTQVLVVGGGVAGVSLLHALASRGIAAMLVTAGALGELGASAIPAALLNPHRGRTGRASALDRAGLAATWLLADRLAAAGHASGVHRGGVLRIASSSRQQDLWRRQLGPTMLEPTDFPGHVRAKHGGMLVAAGGWLEPRPWLTSLRDAALAMGAVVKERTELLTLGRTEPLVATTSSGAITARQVVLCLGAYDASALRLPRLELAPGLAVTFVSDSGAVDGLVSAVGGANYSGLFQPVAGAVGIVFSAAGVVVSGAAHDDAAHDGAVHADPGGAAQDDIDRLRRAAAWFVPALATAPVAGVWRGVRAKRPSGVPVIRLLRPGLTLFGGLGGRGFLCSAVLATRLAAKLAGDLSANRAPGSARR